MKKSFVLAAVVLVFWLFTAAVTAPVIPGQNSAAASDSAEPIPEEIVAILKVSCMACHATDGKRMAMTKLNFSEWDSYKSKKQAKKANAICKEISKGAMPPGNYLQSHPENKLTPEQIEKICAWADTL